MKMYVEYYSHFGGFSREPSEDDKWDRGDAYYESGVVDLYESRDDIDNPNYEEIDDVDEMIFAAGEAYVVYVLYSDGDTFGSTSGHIRVVDICQTEEIADKVENLCRAGTHHMSYVWKGYFSGLDGVYTKKMQIIPHPRYV